MPSSTSRRASPDAHARGRVFALWAGVLAGPLIWLLVLQTNYVLSYVSCETRQTWFLYASVVAAIGLVAAAGFGAWRAGGGSMGLREQLTPPVSSGTCDTRTRWMAHVALLLSAWFIIVILAMSVPVLVLRTCQ